jgi:NAD-dependent histone deacetylase SIR2
MTLAKQITKEWMSQNIKKLTKKRVVIITGAGISVSSGIPDFRSKDGIFSKVRSKLKVKGTDLFSYRYSLEDSTRPIYYKFISNLKNVCDNATPSYTHSFLSRFGGSCRKIRIYTQNIDGLEERCGLHPTRNKNTKLVQLHGNLKYLTCTYCGFKIEFTKERIAVYKEGGDIECERCLERYERRKVDKRRSSPTGMMHTSIIHYHQPHPDDFFINSLCESDMDCNLVVVMGTSLKVYGVKSLVKRFARECRRNGGISISVNLLDPTKEIKEIFDYYWKGSCDDFCMAIDGGTRYRDIVKDVERISLNGSIVEGDPPTEVGQQNKENEAEKPRTGKKNGKGNGNDKKDAKKAGDIHKINKKMANKKKEKAHKSPKDGN